MYPTNEKEALEALKGDDPELAATAEAVLWSAWCRSGDAETDRVFRAGVEAPRPSRGCGRARGHVEKLAAIHAIHSVTEDTNCSTGENA